MILDLPPTDDRTVLFLRYKIERGMEIRYGADWDTPERTERLERELALIERGGFAPYFLILARIIDHCREKGFPTGPGRGSVGGCYVAYALQIHEIDSLEFDLMFERFLTEDRVSWPDIDIDVSQRHRPEILDFIRSEFEDENTVVIQIGAFARAGGRSVIDMMVAATDDYQTGESLKKCLPEGSTVSSGMKQPRELAWWLENGESGNIKRFIQIANLMGWLEPMLKLDCIQTHLAKHAAGVVILSRDDLARMPLCGARNAEDGSWRMLTGYDMYSLDDLDYLKIDVLGLRTLDVISDAHKFMGGSGSTPDLMKIWREHREDPDVYDLFADADTLGVFQVETAGYRRVLKQFEPSEFAHIVQLNALYRPGALDFVREDGKNMVDVFIERKHRREGIFYPTALRQVLGPILDSTQGIILYQEQAMKIAQAMAGFTGSESDELRKAIGKKLLKEMEGILDRFTAGALARGFPEGDIEIIRDNISKSARYSFNMAHSAGYGCLTWLCGYFKLHHRAAFYAAFVNSLTKDKDRQSEAIAEARQHVTILPPDINVAEDGYTVEDGKLVFGLNGIKGMGEINREGILLDRAVLGPYRDYLEFHQRTATPINMKLSLIRCGSFDRIDDRRYLLSRIPKPNRPGETWTIAEAIKDNDKRKKKLPFPPMWDWEIPGEDELAKGEIETIGFYVTADPMPTVSRALARLDGTLHWGGMIESVKFKNDRNNNEMATAIMLTNALTKVRLLIFSSMMGRVRGFLEKDTKVIIRGHQDGNQVIVDGMFTPGDYRHLAVLKARRGNEPEVVEPFDGQLATAEALEAEGYAVQLL